MFHYILLAISLFAGLAYGLCRKYGMEKYIFCPRDTYLFNVISGTVTTVLIAVMMAIRGEFSQMPSFYTVLLGTVFGIVTVLSAIVNMKALGIGPMSYTSVICSCSMIIPSLFGLFRGESLSLIQDIGIVMMLLCMILSVGGKKDERAANRLWFFLCLLAFFLVGSIGIMQQIHQTSPYKSELDAFLLIAFLISSAYALICFLFCRRQETAKPVRLSSCKPFFFLALLTGAGVAACNVINLYLSGVMPAAVFFPVVNGGGLILSALSGIILFRETFSAKRWTGLAIGTCAILLLCLEKILF